MSGSPTTTGSSDVVILGGGVAGSMLATILARKGVSVRVLEAGVHPQFAIGESMIPETGAWFRLMSLRYDIPELEHLSNFQGVRHHVSAACGVKRAFSYVYHREGQQPKVDELLQFPTVAPPIGPDTHFFRQDLDQWLLAAAIRYGAAVRQRCMVKSVAREGEGWRLVAEDGSTYTCRFLVDGAGYRSPLVQMFGLRDEPCRLRTNSRALFTHMVGVRAYDHFLPHDHGMPYPLAQSTLHHVFDGGWMWVIPFDNHREATNPLCSVGLLLDRSRHPDDPRPGQEQFDEFLTRFPGVAQQFKDARAVRPWVTTGRLQYSSKRTTGDGFFLLPHAAGFIDPLFSSGLGFMAWTVNALAPAIIEAKATGDWSEARFKPIEEWTQRHFNHFDRVVSGAYTSYADFDLWNAWNRIWAVGNYHGGMGVVSRYMKYRDTGDRAHLEPPSGPPLRGFASADFPDYLELLKKAEAHLLAFKAGEKSAKDASKEIFALVAAADFCPPPFGFGVPAQRGLNTFTAAKLHQIFWWSRRRAPARIRDWYYGFSYWGMWSLLMAALGKELRRNLGNSLAFLRDMLMARNDEWKRQPGPMPSWAEGWQDEPPAEPAPMQASAK